MKRSILGDKVHYYEDAVFDFGKLINTIKDLDKINDKDTWGPWYSSNNKDLISKSLEFNRLSIRGGTVTNILSEAMPCVIRISLKCLPQTATRSAGKKRHSVAEALVSPC